MNLIATPLMIRPVQNSQEEAASVSESLLELFFPGFCKEMLKDSACIDYEMKKDDCS